jgi:hypothetical protein
MFVAPHNRFVPHIHPAIAVKPLCVKYLRLGRNRMFAHIPVTLLFKHLAKIWIDPTIHRKLRSPSLFPALRTERGFHRTTQQVLPRRTRRNLEAARARTK